MKREIRTPRGALLGIAAEKDGKKAIEYKAGHRIEVLTAEEILEALTGRKVAQIVYTPERELNAENDGYDSDNNR